MPNYRRATDRGGTYFFTVVTHQRIPVLTEPDVRASLHDAIQTIRSEHPFAIDAWVLLPDHLHCIWTLPAGDAGYSMRWAKIKTLVSRQCGARFGARELSGSRTKRHESGLWQRRFWEHQIRDSDDFSRHVDYIHWNPVKHGLARRALDWPYSTFHRYVREGVYPENWGLAETLSIDAGE